MTARPPVPPFDRDAVVGRCSPRNARPERLQRRAPRLDDSDHLVRRLRDRRRPCAAQAQLSLRKTIARERVVRLEPHDASLSMPLLRWLFVCRSKLRALGSGERPQVDQLLLHIHLADPAPTVSARRSRASNAMPRSRGCPAGADVRDPACGSGASSSPWRGPSPSGSSRSALWSPSPARDGSSQTALRASRVGRLAEARGAGAPPRGDDEWPSLAKSSWGPRALARLLQRTTLLGKGRSSA